MGFLDRLLGREPRSQQNQTAYSPAVPPGGPAPGGAAAEDERAVARYRYLLRTAPPEALEQVHAEAFAKLTPGQRSQVLAELSRGLPPGEQPGGDDPQSLARTVTRAELRQPGYLEQTFARSRFGGRFGGMGGGMGGTVLGSMMGTIAGVVVGTAIAEALFDDYADSPEAAEANDTGGSDLGEAQGDGGGTSGDGGEPGGTDVAGADGGGGSDFASGDWGGGDFGGGDFGGGDFSGGDFGGGGF